MSEKTLRRLRQQARRPQPPQIYRGPALYLDTSVLRKAGPRLREVVRRQTATTSLYAIYELLSEVRRDPRSFARRRGALRNIFDARVHIDWQCEEAIIISTFELTAPLAASYMKMGRERIEQPIKRLVDLVMDANDLDALQKALRASSMEATLRRVEEYDESISSQWMSSISEGHRNSRQILDEINSGVRPKPPEMEYSTTKEFSELMLGPKRNLNKYISVRALAGRASQFIGRWHPEGKTISFELLVPSFNGRADIYADALAVWLMTKYGNMGSPGRNDAMDLLHFMYAGSDTTILTEDAGQAEIAKAVCRATMTLDQYLSAPNEQPTT